MQDPMSEVTFTYWFDKQHYEKNINILKRGAQLDTLEIGNRMRNRWLT
jgi:hypothetical protein